MRPSYRTLAGRIRQEMPALARVTQRAAGSLAAARHADDDRYVDAAALNLHAFYSGVERLFEQVARQVDDTLPEGPSWHAELLAQMAAPVTDVRPPVITSDLHATLDRYRGFRHVVRNAYTYNLDAGQIDVLVTDVGATMEMVTAQLAAFADWLDAAAVE